MEQTYSPEDFSKMTRIPRMNLINSLSGIKGAHLIGTINPVTGVPNLSLFSSVIHIGADPAMLGILSRPVEPNGKTSRHTYENIQATKVFTINHVNTGIFKKAHQTSASYSDGVSEFDAVGLTPQYSEVLKAPYVAECRVKMGLEYVEEYFIKANSTILIIGKIIELIVPQGGISEDGHLHLSKLGSVCVESLDMYHSTEYLATLPYARP